MRLDDDYVADILDSAAFITSLVAGKKRDALDDRVTSNAIIRELEIIGEACRHISNEFKAERPAIAWDEIIGMRNILVHAYHDVDLDLVWEAATVDVPVLAVWLA